MPKLTILRGVSGSGKSTWADAQPDAIVVSRDAIRAATFGSNDQDYYEVSREELSRKETLITDIQDATIASGLRAGMHVIVDNTNVRPKFVKSIVDIAYKAGAEVEVKVIDVPVSVAIQRNASRAARGGRMVPEKIIRDQYVALRNSRNWKPVAPHVPTPYSGTPDKPVAFLVDIDGTLANMSGRSPYDWRRVGEDTVVKAVADAVNILGNAMTVIVMSGRDAVCRPETEDWLARHLYGYNALFMRGENDNRPDNIIKAELFDRHVRDNYDVQFVLDDRNQVVSMWRAMGIPCFQVQEGDF